MRILIVANNIEGYDDGIGKHAKMVGRELSKRKDIDKVTYESGETIGFNAIKKVFSLEMTNALKRARMRVENKEVDAVLVEYPFAEFNPLIIPFYYKLHRACGKMGVPLYLSMHEYDRVNKLRRFVIRALLKNTDVIFVSEEKYLKTLVKYSKKMYVRRIPNHIAVPENKKILNRHNYVYFGLINKSKAFDAMLKAWDVFNDNMECHLDIITATPIELKTEEHKNISVSIGLNDIDAASKIYESCFAIIPVIPCIGYNNSSFVSCVQCGCIPVGKFDKTLKRFDFIVHVDNYENELLAGLRETLTISNNDILLASQKAVDFGKQFSIAQTVDQMIEVMRGEFNEYRD